MSKYDELVRSLIVERFTPMVRWGVTRRDDALAVDLADTAIGGVPRRVERPRAKSEAAEPQR